MMARYSPSPTSCSGSVPGEEVAALADRADDIGHQRAARRVAVQRSEFVIGVVHRRAPPGRSSPRVATIRKFFPAAALLGYSTRVRRTPALPTRKRPGFEQDLEPERPQQRRRGGGAVGLKGQRALVLGLCLPPGGLPAGQRVAIDDPDASADREIVDAVLRLEFGGERGDLLNGLDRAGAVSVIWEPMCICTPRSAIWGYFAAASYAAPANLSGMPNLCSLFPVLIFAWVWASTSGLTRMAIGAFTPSLPGDVVDPGESPARFPHGRRISFAGRARA